MSEAIRSSASSAGTYHTNHTTGILQNRVELTPVWPPFLERSHFSPSVTQVQKGGGEGNHSHILSLCTLIHLGSCLYTHIWLRPSRNMEKRWDRGQMGLKKFQHHLSYIFFITPNKSRVCKICDAIEFSAACDDHGWKNETANHYTAAAHERFNSAGLNE